MTSESSNQFYCNTEIHDEVITMDYVGCTFCEQRLQQPSTKLLMCCEKQVLVNSEGNIVYRKCSTVNGYSVAHEFLYFHEIEQKICQKIFQRKYHLNNVIANVCAKNGLQISVSNFLRK